MDIILQGMFGRFGRGCYAVLCLGVILLSATVAHYLSDIELNDPQERTKRRLRAIQGPPIRLSRNSY
ncbi:hypothetical protein Tsubulata_020465 [Turnera subulata]|uniref:Uncharacterized protein n=1 Tax=Turnera subulata TaxID=218843 RepID=A0A9Q0GGR3_9ROSI|nr:hypothetical protein Tsubulata_020465 [Turnera subulata]